MNVMAPLLIENRTFDEISVGESASVTRTLTDQDIQLFALVSGDVNPAHMDRAFAEDDIFHKVIAHGLWGGGLISSVLGTELPGPGAIYLSQSLRFLRPVGLGDAITASVTVTEKRREHHVVLLDCRCVNQRGEEVIVGKAEVRAPTEKVRRPRVALPDVELALHDRYHALLAAAEGGVPVPTVIVHPCDSGSIAAATEAASLGLISPILVGPRQKLEAAAASAGVDIYVNAKSKPFTEAVTERLKMDWTAPCDVRVPGELEALFERAKDEWGGLDFLLHSIAFAPKEDLHGRVVDCSAEGFAMAMDVSCHSFIRMAKLAEPLMPNGGTLLTVTFYGSERVVEHYNLMGPVKAALESATRYLVAELGPRQIRVHAISPGPISTRAASGIDRFDELLERAAAAAPERTLVDISDVGALAAFLVSDAARRITGTVIPVDGGQHLLA